jgi:hypothetical protein
MNAPTLNLTLPVASTPVASPPLLEPVLAIEVPGESYREIALVEGRYAIGSGPRCHVRIAHPDVAPLQATLQVAEGRVRVTSWAPAFQLNGSEFLSADLTAGDLLTLAGASLTLVDGQRRRSRLSEQATLLPTQRDAHEPTADGSPAAGAPAAAQGASLTQPLSAAAFPEPTPSDASCSDPYAAPLAALTEWLGSELASDVAVTPAPTSDLATESELPPADEPPVASEPAECAEASLPLAVDQRPENRPQESAEQAADARLTRARRRSKWLLDRLRATRDEARHWQTQADALTQTQGRHEAEAESWKTQADRLAGELAAAQGDRDHVQWLEAEQRRLGDENALLAEQLASLQTLREEDQRQLQLQLEQAQRELEAASDQLADAEQRVLEADRLRQEAADLTARQSSLEQQNDELRQQVAAQAQWQLQLEQAQRELEATSSLLADAEQRALQADLSRQEAAHVTERLLAAEQQVGVLQQQVYEAQTLREALAAAEARAESTAAELADVRRRLAAAELNAGQPAQAAGPADALTRELAIRDEHIADLRAELAERAVRIEQLEDACDAARAELERFAALASGDFLAHGDAAPCHAPAPAPPSESSHDGSPIGNDAPGDSGVDADSAVAACDEQAEVGSLTLRSTREEPSSSSDVAFAAPTAASTDRGPTPKSVSFIEKYMNLLQEEDEETSLSARLVEFPGNEFTSRDVPLADPRDPSDDDALETYMANLMRRLQETSTPPSLVRADSPRPEPRPEQPPTVAKPVLEPIDLDALKKSTVKHALPTDINALRDLANFTTRGAIANHDRRTIYNAILIRVGLGIAAGIGGVAALAMADDARDSRFLGGSAVLLLASWLCVSAARLLRQSFGSHKSEDAPQEQPVSA